jgi:hypothetical protein
MHRRGAFTLVEALIVIAVVAVLVAIVLFAVRGARGRARDLSDAVRIQSLAMTLLTYTADCREVFPVADENPFVSGNEWYVPLVETQYFEGVESVDPRAMAMDDQRPRFSMSVALTYDHERMVVGATLPPASATSQWVRLPYVVHPDAKGMLFRAMEVHGDISTYFCCTSTPGRRSPIAAVDGSVRQLTSDECIGGDPVIRIDEIGIPVRSTWGGCKGRDWR